MYADDTLYLFRHNDLKTFETRLDGLESLSRWFDNNLMKFNIRKTTFVIRVIKGDTT